jgi:hypothetical protein
MSVFRSAGSAVTDPDHHPGGWRKTCRDASKALLNDERGVIIAAVLTFLAIASALAIALMAEGRAALISARIEAQEIEARIVLDSGIERALMAFQIADDPMLERLRQLKPVPWTWDDRSVELDLDIESGKVDVNAGHLDILMPVVSTVLGSAHAQPVLKRILAARGSGQRIASVSELLDARSVLTSDREKLLQVLTVYTGAEGLDPLSMEQPVIMALRPKTPANGKFVSIQLNHVSAERPIYSLNARWKSAQGRVRHRRVVFVVADTPRKCFVISWDDGDWYESSDAAPASFKSSTSS